MILLLQVPIFYMCLTSIIYEFFSVDTNWVNE